MRGTVFITGASRGIGAATAIEFARHGWNVAFGYHSNQQKAKELEKILGDQALALQADVSDRCQVNQMVEKAISRFGEIDVLVNNAGIAQQKLFSQLTDDDWDAMFQVHVKGAFYATQAVLPKMLKKKQGKIINLSSIWGIAGASMEVHYSAAKAAIIGMTKALAKELGPSGIQVNCVAPGVIQTDMISDLNEETKEALLEQTPLGCLGYPVDIAHLIYFLATDQANFITGQIISPNGGFII